tara:strand:- start:807 stop:995 length:189 start_codon:yes stop_codon:yes gene_type:complete
MSLPNDIDVGQVLKDNWMVENIHLMNRREMISVISMLRESYNKFIDDVLEISAKFSAGVDEE